MKCPWCGEDLVGHDIHYCQCQPMFIDLMKIVRWVYGHYKEKGKTEREETQETDGAGRGEKEGQVNLSTYIENFQHSDEGKT